MNIEKLGTMRAAIEGDVKDLTAGIDLAKKDVKSFGAGVPGWIKPVGTAFVATGALISGALTKMMFDAGKYGDSLDKMSLRTGVSVEALSELSYAVKISGSDVNALETSVRFLNRRMDESRQGIGIAKEQFEKLGISVVDSEGNMRDSIDVMAEVADGIVGLASESERGATAMDIFGARSGPQLLPLLKQGSAGIEELRQKARDLGLTMDTEAAAGAAKFEDSLTDVREAAKMARFELGEVFLPVATDVIDKVTGMVGWFSRLTDEQQKMVGWTTAVSGGLIAVSGAGMLIVGMLPKLITGFATLNITTIGAGFALAGASAGAFATSLWAVYRVVQALDKPVDMVAVSTKVLVERQETLFRALDDTKAALRDFAEDGIDADTVLGDLDLNIGKINRALGTNFTKTTNAATAIAAMERRLDKTTKELDKLTGVFVALGPPVSKATKAIEDLTPVIRESGIATSETVTQIEREKEREVGIWREKNDEISDDLADHYAEMKVIALEGLRALESLEGGALGESKSAQDRARLDELTTTQKTEAKKIEIITSGNEVVKKIQDDGSLHRETLTKKQIADGQRAGQAMVAAREKEAALLEASKVSWSEFAQASESGLLAVNDAYYGVVDVWRSLIGDQREFHDTWISDMADWVTRIGNLMDSVVTIWTNASTIIAKIAQWVGGEGGGAGLAQAAGMIPGGGPGIAKVVGGVGTGAGILAKIGGAGKAVGAGVAKGAGAVAGLPWASIAGIAAPAAGFAAVGIPLAQMIMASFRGEQYSAAGYPKGLGTSIEQAMKDYERTRMIAEAGYMYPAGDIERMGPRYRNIGGRFLASEGGGAWREVGESIRQSNVHLEQIARNTGRLVEREEAQVESIDKQAILNNLADLLAPVLAERGYIS